MWTLETDQDNKRTFANSVTGGKLSQTKVYTDKDGNSWFQFDDLAAIPTTRNFAATKISSLYTLGLSKDDLNGHIVGMKAILKSKDLDKYEKAFALVLDFETKANNATDAIKQMSALTCVYFTMNDERIDSFDNALQIRKMGLLEADPDMHAFFLNRQIEATERYTTSLSLISKIASLEQTG